MRYVAPTEFIRQAGREMRRYKRSPLEKYSVRLVDGVPVLHQDVCFYVQTTGKNFTMTGEAAKPSVSLGADYDFWQLGRSRIEDLLSMRVLQKRKERNEAKAKSANDDVLGAMGEEIEWALNKENGNGIYAVRG